MIKIGQDKPFSVYVEGSYENTDGSVCLNLRANLKNLVSLGILNLFSFLGE